MPVRLGGALVAEFIGTFMLVFLGTLSVFATGGNLVGIALAFGLAVAVIVTATIHTSGGHINPAVTLGFIATGKIKPAAGVAYIVVQLVAAVVASVAVFSLIGLDPGNQTHPASIWGLTTLGKIPNDTNVSPVQGLLAEIIATFFLVFVIWGSAADPRARNTGGFAIGMAVTADILAIGPLTGASMNPARTFGPAVAAQIFNHGASPWTYHWIYWVGPIVGGLMAAYIYHHILWPSDPKRGLDPAAVDVALTQRP